MDANAKLILANAARAENWEDREKANDDVRALMEEFDKRLPPGKSEKSSSSKKEEEKPHK